MRAVSKNARKLEPGNLVSLFEVDYSIQGAEPPNDKLYLHPYIRLAGGTLPFMGKTWQPFPIHFEGVDYNTQGTTPRPKLVVSNIDSIVTALLRQYGDFVACKVTRRRTFQEYLDDGAEHGTAPDFADAQQFAPDIFSIERKSQETATFVEFELTTAWDTEGVSLPRRQILSSFCPWKYRGTECGYVGPPVADKDDNLINVAHVVSPVATVEDDTAISIPSGSFTFTLLKVGGRISGPGIPFGTTIASVTNATHAEMSNPATATATISATIFSSLHDNAVTYKIGDWVYTGVPVIDVPGPGGVVQHFRSLVNGNTAATSDATKWYQTGQAYDAGHTYVLGDYAYVMVNGIRVYYASLADANTSPLTDKTKWVRDDCSKRVIACKGRFGPTNPLPFGGFPGAGKIPTGA